jgi:hypothetical protein
MAKGKVVALDEKRARAELLGIAEDLRAVEQRARALNTTLGRTAEFRRARALALKDDEAGALGVLAWFWSGGLGDVIMALRHSERQCRSDSRVKAPG